MFYYCVECRTHTKTPALFSKLTHVKMEFKIPTLNLSLGIKNKKNFIKEMIISEKINILCMQETEININLDHNLLSIPGFSNETEKNSAVSRVAIYIENTGDYVRRVDLEGQDSNLIIIDLVGEIIQES